MEEQPQDGRLVQKQIEIWTQNCKCYQFIFCFEYVKETVSEITIKFYIIPFQT